MIIYNVTVFIDESIHSKWIKWTKHEYIPKILSTKLFQKAVLSRVISNEELTYTIAFYAKSNSQLKLFKKNHSSFLKQKSFKKCGDVAPFFKSEIEFIDEFVK